MRPVQSILNLSGKYGESEEHQSYDDPHNSNNNSSKLSSNGTILSGTENTLERTLHQPTQPTVDPKALGKIPQES